MKPTPCSIHVPLYEHESGGDAFASWPQAVRNIHDRELAGWTARNPDLDIVETTHSIDVVRRVTVTEWHYALKAEVAA